MSSRALKGFILILFSILLVIFIAHVSVLHLLNHDAFANSIITSYIGNFLLTIVIFTFIYNNREKKTERLGFFFLGGSMIKFTLFFIFLYPLFMQDDLVSRLEFLSFFIPYSVALSVETQQLIKELNKA
ncbi:MAG: hypothetical protein HON40_00505 [Flavobacteriales bacterium]|jgi:hypothetical protein|nr:hypothetical protein [Flavobacteriales bacterium]|tara:strand:- start:732 stop:1118 length:387 start_codon:yes stop_codon:yes gene_type:complete